MKHTYFILILVFLLGCASEEAIQDKADNEKTMNTDKKYRTYKNQVPMMNTGREKLEKLSDVENATRNILNTFDNHKSKISSSSQE